MKKRILGAALAAIVAAGGAAADPTRIGMITTLSGGGAHLGVDVRDGFQLALEQAGRKDVELIVRDDARKPDMAKSLADEMIQKDKVAILTGIIWSNLAMAVVPSAVRQGVFYISPNAGPSALAGRGCHRNYFNVAWQNDDLHAAMGAYMKAQGFKRPFILAPNYPAGTDALTGFKSTFGADVGGELYTKLGQTDYAAEIARIRASDADSVFFFLPGGMGIAFLKQYAGAGMTLPVFGPAFSFDEVILGAVGDAAIGARNTSQWAYDLDNAANRAFVEAFRKTHGRTPTLYASQGYDAARLILSALDAADPVKEPDAFREALRAARFESVRGKFRFGPNHHPIQDIYVREVVPGDGKPTNRLIGVAMRDRQDAYAAQCRM
ncbi:ABC transporter substrate-binding protein [Oceanicella actignis]|uniref:ABC transporter substrate-binding protein n=1 Tax=Oceanicella actignis TaxID=1189325 RepID=UPI0011E85A74|nr:ABC transporter substrate-binding protein [Oceanicella actignis]TYO89186.1 branched-chain amino acid transport system substrate-binding protein [Oceanicella actignis]